MPIELKKPPGALPMKIVMPEDLFLEYADNFAVQNTGDEFILSFLQTQHPVLMSDLDVKDTKFVEALCFARIVLTPTRAAEFLRVLQTQLEGSGMTGSNAEPSVSGRPQRD